MQAVDPGNPRLQGGDALHAKYANARRGGALCDFSEALLDARNFFDSDHLNRNGLEAFFAKELGAVLVEPTRPS
jgi:hypothetical protein